MGELPSRSQLEVEPWVNKGYRYMGYRKRNKGMMMERGRAVDVRVADASTCLWFFFSTSMTSITTS